MTFVETVPARETPRRRARGLLFFGFAFAVMADPVSSVAYAIEAALRALGGHLELLLPTMGLVIGLIALVTLNYWQLVRAFPEGGGSPEAAGRAFGQPWTFLPIGALVVDFALTIAISVAAAGSALVALAPAVAPVRIPVDLALVVAVAGLTWFGHAGRLVFGVMTSLFIVASIPVLALGWLDPHQAQGAAPITHSASPALVAVILAFPVAMALATGTEAPATSIAQLGQLGNRGKRRFGQGTLALGSKCFTRHLQHGIDNSDIGDVAGANLTIDHLLARGRKTGHLRTLKSSGHGRGRNSRRHHLWYKDRQNATWRLHGEAPARAPPFLATVWRWNAIYSMVTASRPISLATSSKYSES